MRNLACRIFGHRYDRVWWAENVMHVHCWWCGRILFLDYVTGKMKEEDGV